MKNKVIKGRNNPILVSFMFDGVFSNDGLNNFSNIEVTIDEQTFSLVNNSTIVEILDKNILSISLGNVLTATEKTYPPKIVGYSPTYPDGYLLTGECNRLLENIIVVEEC